MFYCNWYLYENGWRNSVKRVPVGNIYSRYTWKTSLDVMLTCALDPCKNLLDYISANNDFWILFIFDNKYTYRLLMTLLWCLFWFIGTLIANSWILYFYCCVYPCFCLYIRSSGERADQCQQWVQQNNIYKCCYLDNRLWQSCIHRRP